MKDKIKNKKFLVTGGAGFVGSHAGDFILKNGGKVACVDNFLTGKKDNIRHLIADKRFKLYKADANNLKEMSQVFKKAKPDYVMHYAAMVGVKRTVERPLEVFRDFDGTKHVADLSKKYGIKGIFYSSSSEVYGEPLKLPIKEDDISNARLPYGLVKVISERYLQEFSKKYGIPVTIGRFFNVYGPRQDFGESGFVVSVFLKKALLGQPLEIFGDGSQTRDFVYIDDNIRLSMKAFFNKETNGQPMNIGSGRSIKIKKLAEAVCDIVPGTGIIYKPMRSAGEIVYRQPDVSFMEKILDDRPIVKLRDGLKITADYFKKIK